MAKKKKKTDWLGSNCDCGKGHLFYYSRFGKKFGDKMSNRIFKNKL